MDMSGGVLGGTAGRGELEGRGVPRKGIRDPTVPTCHRLTTQLRGHAEQGGECS